MLLAGTPIAADEMGRRLTEFNDREWEVADAAERLVERHNLISRFRQEELDLIKYRKLDVRRDLQKAINFYGQSKKKVDLEELKRIRESIRDLNKAIDEVEDILLHGQR